MDQHSEIYQVSNVTKTYKLRGGPANSTLTALNGITLSISTGETLGVVGESGCGKSTLGRIMTALEPLTTGNLSFEGSDLNELGRTGFKQLRKRLQIIFQDPYGSLNPRQRIGQALEEPLSIHKTVPVPDRRKAVISMLERVGLDESDYSKFPHQFSGGQRQRICIARALIVDPSFVVCDEAVSALDVSVQAKVLDLLQDLQAQLNLTYLFISHDLGVVKQISDRVLVMYLGKMMELASSTELFDNPKHPYTQALKASAPLPDPTRRRERVGFGGEPPSPADPPQGCVFNTRCPLATDLCRKEVPEWREISRTHWVACHYAEP